MRVVFMGTPTFSTASLEAIFNSEHKVVGVVTAPDRPAGRGKKLKSSAIKEFALEKGLRILQPERLKDESFLSELHSLKADVFVVVAFRMLPEQVWGMPPKGTFNLHASLLPDYRGAAPINHAILNGDRETGVSTFLIEKEIDTGNILFQEKLEINEDDNAGSLHDKLMVIGAKLVIKTLNAIEANSIEPIAQEKLELERNQRPAPKIFKEDCQIDWSRSALTVHNKVRALSPYPCAYSTLIDGERRIQFKFQETKIVDLPSSDPGSIESDNKSSLIVSCADRQVEILKLQMEGKKAMGIEEFLRGFQLSASAKFR